MLYVTEHQEMEQEKEKEVVDFDLRETLFSTSPMPPTLTGNKEQTLDCNKAYMTLVEVQNHT